MNKNGIKGYISLAIILVVFSVIAFVLPFQKNAVFCIAYLSGVIAIAYQIYVFKISFGGDSDAKSRFYGFPIARIGVIYMIVQLAVSIIEIVCAAYAPLWVCIILNVVLLGIVALGCIAADTMKEEIIKQDVKIKKDVSNMRNLQSMSATLAGQCEEKELKKLLSDMAEEFKYSDPVTSENTKDIEEELKEQMNEIQSAIIDGDDAGAMDLSKKILGTLAERNRLCKLNK